MASASFTRVTADYVRFKLTGGNTAYYYTFQHKSGNSWVSDVSNKTGKTSYSFDIYTGSAGVYCRIVQASRSGGSVTYFPSSSGQYVGAYVEYKVRLVKYVDNSYQAETTFTTTSQIMSEAAVKKQIPSSWASSDIKLNDPWFGTLTGCRYDQNEGEFTFTSTSPTINVAYTKIVVSTYNYYLRYHANGGTGGPNDQSTLGTTLTSVTFKVSSTEPTRTNCTFLGWSFESTATKADYVGGDTVTLNSEKPDRTLYAIWKYSYKITYYKNDGSNVSKALPTSSGTSSTQSYTIPDPVEDFGWTRTGYYFQGWFNDSTTTTTQYLVGSSYDTSSNKSIYAHWQPNSYTIYFNGNGATSGSMSPMSCYYGSTYELNSNAYKRIYTLTYDKNYTGASSSDISVPCTFLYWSCNNSTYKNGASVSNLTSTNGGSVTMKAQWEYGSVTLPTLIRSGYEFDGWYTSSGSYIGAGGSSYTVKSNQTLYAHWKISVIKPTITYVSHTDTTIKISLDRNDATTGSWIIEASLSNFGTVIDTTTITSTSQTTITLTGLTPEATYYIRARHVNGDISVSSNVISATTRTSTFQWTSNDSVYVIKGAVFTDAITAAKWKELIKKVNWCRKKKGLSIVSLNEAVRGQPILADDFTDMRNAIAEMGIVVTPAREPGDEILATYFANSDTSLKSAINAVITTL